MPSLPYLQRGLGSAERPAVIDSAGAWSYAELASAVDRAARALAGPHASLSGERVGVFLPPDKQALAAFLAILEAGGLAVPLSIHATPREVAYQLTDAGISRVIADAAFAPRLDETRAQGASPQVVELASLFESNATGGVSAPALDAPAVMLYTSGTTGQPKGVVHSHASLINQVDVLFRAWGWSEADRLLHVLPLHHVHGLLNGVLGCLWAGAELRLEPKFDAAAVWQALVGGEASVFYAVPTIYHQLVGAWERQDVTTQAAWVQGAQSLRLGVSGSAALPATLWRRWQEITGQALLERYGMTEIGMALSNPYQGERRAGTVGQALPMMEVRLVDEEGNECAAGEPGEIWTRGGSLFSDYWGKPDATRDSFRDGWFLTGDIAELDDGYYRILGRASADIIKSGGYKLSALEIESVLTEHPAISEVAVVGAPNEEWGEVVTACVVLRDGASLSIDEVRAWCVDKLSSYKQPRRLQLRPSLPRNAMGKVLKPELRASLEG